MNIIYTPEMQAAITLFHRRYAKAMMLVHDDYNVKMLEGIREHFATVVGNSAQAFNEHAHKNIAQITEELRNGAEPTRPNNLLFRLLDQFYLMLKENAELEVAAVLSPEPVNGVMLKIVDEAVRALMGTFQDREQVKVLLDTIIASPLMAKRIFERIAATYWARTESNLADALKQQVYGGDRTGMRGQFSTAVAHDAQALHRKAEAQDHLNTVADAIQGEDELHAAARLFDGTVLVHVIGIGHPAAIEDIGQRVQMAAPNATRVHALVYHGVTIDRVRQFYRTTMDDGASTFLKDELAKESPKIMNLIVHPYPLGDGAAEQEHDNNVGYSNIIQQAVFELGGTVYHIGMNQIDDLRKLTEAVGAAAGGVKSAREVKPETKANMVEIQQTIDNYDGSVVLHFVGESDPTIISEKMLKFHEVMKDRPVYLIDYQGTDVVRSHQHLMNQMDYLTDVLLKHPNVVHYIIAPAGIVVKDTAARGGVDSFEGELSVRVYLQAVAVGLNNLCVPVTVLDDRRLNEPSMFLGNLAWTIKARKRSVNLHVSQAEVGSYSAEPKFGPETPMSVRLAFDGVLVAHAAGVTDPDELQVLQSRLEKTIPNGRVMVVSYPCSDVQDDQQSFINLMENLSRSIIEGQMDMVNIVVPNKEVTMADVSAIGHAQALSKIINTAGVPAVIVIINDDVSDRKLEADVAFVIKQGKFVLQPTSREKSFGVLSLIAQGSGKQGERVMPDKSQGEPEVGRPGWYDRPAPALTPVDERLNPRTLGEVERREPDFSQAVVSFDGVVVLHTYSNGKLQLLSERVHVIRDTLQQARLYTLPYDGYASSEILDRVNENFHTGEPIWTEGKDGVKVAHVILFNGKLEPARISSPTTMVELELHHLLQGVHMHDRRAMFFDDEDFTSHEKLVEALNKVVEYAMEKSVQDPAAAEQAAQVAEAIGDARTEQANPGLQKFMENSANLEENIAGVIKQFLDSLPEEERSQLVGTMNDGILVSSALDRLINMGVIENRQ